MEAQYLHHLQGIAAAIPRKLQGNVSIVELLEWLCPTGSGSFPLLHSALIHVAVSAMDACELKEVTDMLHQNCGGGIVPCEVDCPGSVTNFRLSLEDAVKCASHGSIVVVVVRCPGSFLSRPENTPNGDNLCSFISEMVAVRRFSSRKRLRSGVGSHSSSSGKSTSSVKISALLVLDDAMSMRQVHNFLRASIVESDCDLRCFDLQAGTRSADGRDDAIVAAFLFEVLRFYPVMLSTDALNFLRLAWHGNNHLSDVCFAFHMMLCRNARHDENQLLFSQSNQRLIALLYARVSQAAAALAGSDSGGGDGQKKLDLYPAAVVQFATLYVACCSRAASKLHGVTVEEADGHTRAMGDVLCECWDDLHFVDSPHGMGVEEVDAMRCPLLFSPLSGIRRSIALDEASTVMSIVQPPSSSVAARCAVAAASGRTQAAPAPTAALDDQQQQQQQLDFFSPSVSDAARVQYVLLRSGDAGTCFTFDQISQQCGISGRRLAVALLELKHTRRVSINATKRSVKLM